MAITSMRDGRRGSGPRDSSERVSVLTLNFIWHQGLLAVPWDHATHPVSRTKVSLRFRYFHSKVARLPVKMNGFGRQIDVPTD